MYVFTIIPPSYIIQTTWLVITLPDEVTVYNAYNLERYCGKNILVGFTNNTDLDCSVSN